MILGNTNGNNRGKKYLKNKNICHSKCYPDKAIHFNTWFEENIRPLKVQLFNKYHHISNEDIFNDTYLRIYERIYYTGFQIADYRSYFCRAFYTNHVQEISKYNRFIDFEPNINIHDEDNLPEKEIEQQHRLLEEDIFDYVYHNFDIREYEIFKMYMRLKIQGKYMNYEILARIINNEEYKVHNIQAIISKIKKSVSKEFSDRWSKVS
ncbi:MAG: hypothetical protein E6772_07810 [Dysgonomonas sp.]|nr:hypothetical protein [Dysgonomonas sp.]